jgi:hypothetical protein
VLSNGTDRADEIGKVLIRYGLTRPFFQEQVELVHIGLRQLHNLVPDHSALAEILTITHCTECGMVQGAHCSFMRNFPYLHEFVTVFPIEDPIGPSASVEVK